MDLKLELAQQQVLSQRMIQSAQILQMSTAELETYLKEAAVENPVIELEERRPEPEIAIQQQESINRLEWLSGADEQNRHYYADYSRESREDHPDLWNIADNRGEDLGEYLRSQTVLLHLSQADSALMDYMIGLIDSRGYYPEPPAETAGRLQVSETRVTKLLTMIRAMEPAGVGARDLKECLMIQLDRGGIEDALVRTLVSDYLEELGKNHLTQVARKLKVTPAQIGEALSVIRTLNPKPGNSFSSGENLKYIVPDVSIIKIEDHYEIRLGDNVSPGMRIGSYYKRLLKQDSGKEVREYVDSRIRKAEWIMQCVAQRNETLMRVSRTILEGQMAFFEKGPGNLRPMIMADAARQLDIHESTVSRAVKDKYLQCAWGVFPMNYFFTAAVSRNENAAVSSADEVKRHIKEIIAAENSAKPLSDQKITNLLQERGITISRRTVAKYREAMGLPDAGGRKHFL